MYSKKANMIVFEIGKKPALLYKAWREIYHLLFFNIGLAIGNIAFYSKYYLIIDLCVFGLLLIKLFSNRGRQICKLLFNDEEKVLTVFYYQFIAFRFTKKITYNMFNYSYKHKLYRRAITPKTLEFRREKKLVAEIKQKYNLGWTNEEVDNIYCKLEKIKQNEHDN
jgi:hypothetical protein